MSLKKATPKAVFEACEQLELLDRSWNRDDVRNTVGGGSFSVIDPLIQAWRKLQPVREVAPSVPADLLLQVASMLEKQVSDYIADIELRDQEREAALLEAHEITSENLHRIEYELSEQLEASQQANHDLDAECSRLEVELVQGRQAQLETELKLSVSEEAVKNLNERLQEQQSFHASTIQQLKESQQEERARAEESHQLLIDQLKLESQQQLVQQKSELHEASQLSENRLMRLIDQGRNELKESQFLAAEKIELLSRDLNKTRQTVDQQQSEIKALNLTLREATEHARGIHEQHETQLFEAKSENNTLKAQLKDKAGENNDLTELKASILALQSQLLKV